MITLIIHAMFAIGVAIVIVVGAFVTVIAALIIRAQMPSGRGPRFVGDNVEDGEG